LRTGGLKVDPERIVLAGTATLDLIAKERPAARLLLLGGASLRAYARRLGLTLAEDFCDLVVLARDRRFTYAKLAAAVEALRRGASLIATNPDRSHPGPEGAIVPETGALLAAILACVGPVKFRVVGKPEPLLFEAGLARLGVAANEAVMIGDNEETDGLGARRLGLRFIKVEPGNGRDGAPCFV
jgi:ribonucleotide monophosphatase NagD (HAD superfamily)